MRAAGTGTDHFPAWLTGAGRIINVNAGRQVCQGGTKFDDGVNIANPQPPTHQWHQRRRGPGLLERRQDRVGETLEGREGTGHENHRKPTRLGPAGLAPPHQNPPGIFPVQHWPGSIKHQAGKMASFFLLFFSQKIEPLLNRAKDKDPKGEKKIERKKERTRPVL